MKKIKAIIISFCLISIFGNNIVNANTTTIEFEVKQITNNIYSIISPSFGLPTPENKGWNSNVHFVITNDGVLLFDSGSSQTIGNQIKKTIQSITNKPVRWIINSHSHADHWLGNAAFADTAIEIIASDKTFKTMEKYGEDDVAFYKRVTNGTIGTTKLSYPNLIISKNEKRNFGNLEVELIFSNDAHSPGDILMWLPKQKIIFGGDVLSSNWMPVITDHGNIPNLLDTLKFIVKLNPTHVLTGHGNTTNVNSVIRDLDLLSHVWKQVQSDYKNNKKPNDTILKVKTALRDKYKLLYNDFDAEIERHIKLMYKLQ